MAGLRVTDLTRTEKGYWTATITVGGMTAAVDDSSGSWQTTRGENGCTRDVHPWIAAALQQRVRVAERKLAKTV